MPPQVRVLSDLEALSREGAIEIARRAAGAVDARGRFAIALAGGSTPRRLYALLAGGAPDFPPPPFPWGRTDVFWSDERCVPPDHPDSNHRMAQRVLLSRVPVPPLHVHRLRGEDPDPDRAARQYERLLRRLLPPVRPRRRARGAPGRRSRAPSRFDLVLLGIGADGHVASLFPGDAALRARGRLTVPVAPSGSRPLPRLTLTLPAINAAACVVILAAGREKAEAVAAALDRAPRRRDAGRDLPARLVRPRAGDLIWLVDRGAAAKLERSVILSRVRGGSA